MTAANKVVATGRVLTAATCRLARRCAFWRSGQERAVEVCLVVLNLIQDLQLHRALSGAVLDGRTEFGGRLDAVQHKLQRSLYALADHYGDRHPIFRGRQWRVTLGRWESVHHNWQGLDHHTNLYAHSEVILGHVETLRAIAYSEAKRLGPERIDVVLNWPRLIEHLGLLRALGLHALCRVEASVDDRTRASLTRQMWAAQTVLRRVQAAGCDGTNVILTERALGRVTWLLDGNLANYHPHPFYEEMTAVIDAWYRAIRDHLQGEVMRRPQGRLGATPLRGNAKVG